MERVLGSALRSFINRGNLRLTMPSGLTFIFGNGGVRPVAARLTAAAAVRQILLDPEMGLGKSYMDGTLVMEAGSISDLLALVLHQQRDKMLPIWGRPQWMMRYLWRRRQQRNGRMRARNNVAHHYDLDDRLYSLFLDADLQYSCAYFEEPGQSLDDAQLAKKRHLTAKLLLRPGDGVLDIGCGWGGLAIYLAEHCGAEVTGITLSEEQLRRAYRRADDNNLFHTARFRLQVTEI